MKTRFAVLVLYLVVFAGIASAASPLRVATMPLNPPGMIFDLAAAYSEKTGQPIAVTVCRDFDEISAGLQTGKFDAALGTCPNSAAKLVKTGLAMPGTVRPFYYHRLAIILPPKNPLQIMGAADLERPGLRIGIMDYHTNGTWIDAIKSRAKIICRDQDTLLNLLEQGCIDAAVTWDIFGDARPQLVTIRVPQSIAGAGAALDAACFVANKTTNKDQAQAFLDFCINSHEASKVMLSHCAMTENGSFAEQYKKGAGNKMMPAYRALAQQINQDYAKGRKNCLDLGCGTGEMTVEVAKATGLEVTGLDIEPEAIELAQQYAKDCGVGKQMHWVAADVHSLPYPDTSFDLVISRGSIFFWRDQTTALREVMRVLKPGGYAFIGGGYGRLLSKEDWEKIHPGVDPAKNAEEAFHFPFPLKNIPALMTRAGIADYRYISEGGTWIEFQKPSRSATSSTREQ